MILVNLLRNKETHRLKRTYQRGRDRLGVWD